MGLRDEVPLGYDGPDGKTQKLFLQDALERLQIPYDGEEELKKLGGDYRNCDEMASRLAVLVEKTWSEVRDQSGKLFPGS